MNASVQKQSGNQVTVDWMPNGLPEFDLSTMPSWSCSHDLVKRYQEDGAVLMRGVFRDWVKPLRRGLQRNLDAPNDYAFPCESIPAGKSGRFFDSYCNWLLIPEYFEYVTQSSAASMAGQLMEAQAAQFFHEHTFCKEPGTQRETPWHQDLPYYCVDGNQTVSLYVALDQTPANVAVRFVKGSHRWGKLYHPVAFEDGADFAAQGECLESVQDIQPSEHQILNWELASGDCIAFNFRTVHGTKSDKVTRRRRAFSTRWLGDDVVYCERNIETSPPLGDMGLRLGDRMREDWFPVLWRRS